MTRGWMKRGNAQCNGNEQNLDILAFFVALESLALNKCWTNLMQCNLTKSRKIRLVHCLHHCFSGKIILSTL